MGPSALPRPVRDLASVVNPAMLPLVEGMRRVAAVGSLATVRRQLGEIVDRYRPDEVFFVCAMHDHAARLTSFRLAAEASTDLALGAAAQ